MCTCILSVMPQVHTPDVTDLVCMCQLLVLICTHSILSWYKFPKIYFFENFVFIGLEIYVVLKHFNYCFAIFMKYILIPKLFEIHCLQ